MKTSKYKNKITFEFYSNSNDISEHIAEILVDTIEDNKFNIKCLNTKVETYTNDLYGKGDELLKGLGIKVYKIENNQDLINAKNASAILISNKKEIVK